VTDADVIGIATQAMLLAAKLAAPFLLVTLGIGLVVGLLQSVTQLQEPTLTFVPKFAGAAAVLLVGGTWMSHQAVTFTQGLFHLIPQLIAS
jgi:flagellar biosynthetic protein FliQ